MPHRTPGGMPYANSRTWTKNKKNKVTIQYPKQWHILNASNQRPAPQNVSTHDKAVAPTLALCPNCGAWHIYHTVCGECGYYRGKQAIVKDEAA